MKRIRKIARMRLFLPIFSMTTGELISLITYAMVQLPSG